MSQRLLENHIRRRLNVLNRQIDLRRERALRERNEQRLRILQRGRGREPRKVISDFYRIIVNRTRHSRKFKSEQNVYNVTLKELPENPTFVRRLFRDIVKNVKLQMEANPNDYFRVNIDHPSLDSPVWIEFIRSKNLNEDKLLGKIEAVQQSKKESISTTPLRILNMKEIQFRRSVCEYKFLF
jgi:hypothetical protein